MALDIWSKNDIRNIILAVNAAAPAATPEHDATYEAGYEAALVSLASAFDVHLVKNGRLRTPGVVIPGSRLAVSYRAEKDMQRFLARREEWGQ
jgi:hypothetical protein